MVTLHAFDQGNSPGICDLWEAYYQVNSTQCCQFTPRCAITFLFYYRLFTSRPWAFFFYDSWSQGVAKLSGSTKVFSPYPTCRYNVLGDNNNNNNDNNCLVMRIMFAIWYWINKVFFIARSPIITMITNTHLFVVDF